MPILENQPTAKDEGTSAPANARDRDFVLARLAQLRPLTVKPAAGLIRYPYCIPGGFVGLNLLLQDMIEMLDGLPNNFLQSPTPEHSGSE